MLLLEWRDASGGCAMPVSGGMRVEGVPVSALPFFVSFDDSFDGGQFFFGPITLMPFRLLPEAECSYPSS